MIVFDLEWNQGRGTDSLEEIIQIGAVRLDRLGGRITGSFNAYIRLCIHSRLSVGAKRLPDLALSMNATADFPSAYQDFLGWCGDDDVFAAWGAQDLHVLEKNAAHWGLPAPRVSERFDLQAAFGRTVGTSRCIALEHAVSYCGIPDVFSYHNALSDALYAALVSEHIAADSLYAPPAPPKYAPKRLAFAEVVPKKASAPLRITFPERNYALDNLKLRRFTCPRCGAPLSLAHWFSLDEQTYYGYFSCHAHGRFFCRMQLRQLENHGWQAERRIFAPSSEDLDAFYAARRNDPHHCKKSSRRKKKQYWYFRNRPAAAAKSR